MPLASPVTVTPSAFASPGALSATAPHAPNPASPAALRLTSHSAAGPPPVPSVQARVTWPFPLVAVNVAGAAGAVSAAVVRVAPDQALSPSSFAARTSTR